MFISKNTPHNRADRPSVDASANGGAYIDARYKMDEYTITKEELEYLAEKVNRLKGLTETLCQAKIKQIGLARA